MTAEMSVFDMLLDRHDPSMPLDIKQEPSESRQDLLDMAMRDSEMVSLSTHMYIHTLFYVCTYSKFCHMAQLTHIHRTYAI